jgi:hypothetical protein
MVHTLAERVRADQWELKRRMEVSLRCSDFW